MISVMQCNFLLFRHCFFSTGIGIMTVEDLCHTLWRAAI